VYSGVVALQRSGEASGYSPQSPSRSFTRAKTLRSLRHPHICYFLDTCMINGAPVIVLELLDGGTLGQHIHLEHLPMNGTAAERGAGEVGVNTASDEGSVSGRPATETWSAIPSSELQQLVKDVALGLHYLHTNGVTHCDVKHSNVMIEHGQTVRAKLCDFGLSTLKSATQEGGFPSSFSSVGTMRYQAPEMTQLMIASPSRLVPSDKLEIMRHTRIDVYAYGLMLYEVLHGCIFFGELSPVAVVTRTGMGNERPPIALRPEHSSLSTVIDRCWDAEAEHRPDMQEVIETLSALG